MTDLVTRLREGLHDLDINEKLNPLLDDAANEIERLKEKCNRQAMVIRRMYVEEFPDTWFVHNARGEVDQNGLPQYIDVCPAYGCDWTQVYERTKNTIGGMGS